LTSSAIGLVSGTGEIFGGGIGPMLAGYVAQHYGIEKVPQVSLIGLCIGVVLSLFLRETAPRRVRAAALARGVVPTEAVR
jgi:fucose permease